MFRSTAIRIGIVIAAILVTSFGVRWIGRTVEQPDVEMPRWTFNELPLQLGDWRGEDTKRLDPELYKATDADVIVNRAYQDGTGHSVSIHTAVFKNPAHGVYHSPMNCYLSAGWQKIKTTMEKLVLPNDVVLPVCLTTWELDNQRLMVVYWYQLGEHVLFGRWDLGLKVRLSLAGRPKWPALIKVMLTIPVRDAEEAQTVLLGFAKEVAAWENQPAHQTGLKPTPKKQRAED
jgi:EpsI family protein